MSYFLSLPIDFWSATCTCVLSETITVILPCRFSKAYRILLNLTSMLNAVSFCCFCCCCFSFLTYNTIYIRNCYSFSSNNSPNNKTMIRSHVPGNLHSEISVSGLGVVMCFHDNMLSCSHLISPAKNAPHQKYLPQVLYFCLYWWREREKERIFYRLIIFW